MTTLTRHSKIERTSHGSVGTEGKIKNSTTDIPSAEGWETHREEVEEDEANDQAESSNHRLPVADAFRNNPVGEKPDDRADLSSVGQSRLPSGANLISLDAIHDTGRATISLVELGHTIEVANQEGVVALHDDR